MVSYSWSGMNDTHAAVNIINILSGSTN
uniref:Uncharacterized protein n=1 Tax=Rhizophora mucronata TaxID=61149 RepID=A0A2P2N547_RHIMU